MSFEESLETLDKSDLIDTITEICNGGLYPHELLQLKAEQKLGSAEIKIMWGNLYERAVEWDRNKRSYDAASMLAKAAEMCFEKSCKDMEGEEQKEFLYMLVNELQKAADEDGIGMYKEDTRSSNYLEDAATEIQVQGLELDYACVLWDADMRFEDGTWSFYRFNRQTKWVKQIDNSESKHEQMKYMLNAYRVLLTRARAGMVICVPTGNNHKNLNGFWEDSTRIPEYYDGTYEYLKGLGIKEL